VKHGSGTEPLFSPERIRQLGRLDWIAEAIVNGLEHGLHRSHRKGFSSEFSDYKAYTPGDDTRFIDWRVYVRTERLFVRCFEAETSLECLLLLDASQSMAWRWQNTVSKLDYGTVLCAAFTYLLTGQDDQVGLAVHDARRMRFVPLSSRRTQFERVLGVLGHVDPGSASTFPALVDFVAELRKHRGQIILISDLEEEKEDLEHGLMQLAARDDEVMVLHLLDRAEVQPPFPDATTHLVDSETGAQWAVDMKRIKEQHAQRITQFRQRWNDYCGKCGIVYCPVDTSMDYVRTIMELVQARETRA